MQNGKKKKDFFFFMGTQVQCKLFFCFLQIGKLWFTSLPYSTFYQGSYCTTVIDWEQKDICKAVLKKTGGDGDGHDDLTTSIRTEAFKQKNSSGRAFLHVTFLFNVSFIYDYIVNFSGVYLSRTRALQFCSGSTRAVSTVFP